MRRSRGSDEKQKQCRVQVPPALPSNDDAAAAFVLVLIVNGRRRKREKMEWRVEGGGEREATY